ncbi:MAG: WD40 repeat domain-containing serine/threonine-protein kinase [Planctomycetota bacterium]
METPGNNPSTDSREKWIAIDRLCDAYEASLQEGEVERAPFLAGVPVEWREQLTHEFDAIDASYRDAKETTEDIPHLATRDRPDHDPTEFEWSENPRRLPNIGSLASLVDEESKTAWLGRFEVKERLGSGATGSVWRARDDRLDRWVALKVPHATRVMSDTTAARFKTEARAAAAISHPNVVQVHEVLIEDGLPILIQQWIDGPSLASSLNQSGPMDCDRAADWMIQIADAVACAHDHGIVHRDLKPANVMLSKGRPMVLDFGLASYPEFSSGLTTEGTMLGTPAYMSPEQAEGKDSSEPTSDIYSLGAVLYEMLVGKPPFVGKTSDVLESVKHAMPSAPRQHRPSIPRDLQTITLRCLAKSPKARYASASELRDDLKRFRERKPIRARKVTAIEQAIVFLRARPVATMLWITIPLLVLFAAGFALSRVEHWELSDRADHLVEQQRANSFRSQALLEQRNLLRLARASQELSHGDRRRGQEMLSDIGEEQRRWEWRLLNSVANSPAMVVRPSVKAESILPGMSLTAITRSPDGNTLYVGTDSGRILQCSLSDGEDAELTELCTESAAAVHAIDISPDGRVLACVDSNGVIITWDLLRNVRGERRTRASRQPGYAVAFSTDGKWLAVGGGKSAQGSQPTDRRSWLETYSVTPTGKLSESRQLSTNENTQVGSLCFYSAQDLLVARGGPGIEVEQAGAVEHWQVGPKQLTRVDKLWHGLNARGLDYHPAKNLVAWCDSIGIFYVYDLRGKRVLLRKRASSGALHQVRFSSNAKRLYCVGDEPEVSAWALRPTIRPARKDAPEKLTLQTFRLADLRGHVGTVRDVIVTAPLGKSHDTARNPGDLKLLGPITASEDGTVRAWRQPHEEGSSRTEFFRHITYARWADETTIAVATFAGADSKVSPYQTRELSGHGITLDERHLRFVDHVAACGDGRYIASCRDRVEVFETFKKKPTATFRLEDPESSFVTAAIALDRNNVLVASTQRLDPSKDQVNVRTATLQLFRLGKPRPVRTIELEDARPISSMALSPDGSILAAGTYVGDLMRIPVGVVTDGLDTDSIHQWPAHGRTINEMVWLGGSDRLASVSNDGGLAIWSLNRDEFDSSDESFTIEPDHSVRGGRPMLRIESSPLGDRIVTVGEDRVIRVWDTHTGLELISLPRRSQPVSSIGISPNAEYLMVADLHAIDVIRLKPATSRERSTVTTQASRAAAE